MYSQATISDTSSRDSWLKQKQISIFPFLYLKFDLKLRNLSPTPFNVVNEQGRSWKIGNRTLLGERGYNCRAEG